MSFKKSVILLFILLFLSHNTYSLTLLELYDKGLNNPMNFSPYGSYWSKEKTIYNIGFNTSLNRNPTWSINAEYDIYNKEKEYQNNNIYLQKRISKENLAADIATTYLRIIADNKCQPIIEQINEKLKQIPFYSIDGQVFREENQIYIYKTKRRYKRHRNSLNNRIGMSEFKLDNKNFFWNIKDIEEIDLYNNLKENIKKNNVYILLSENNIKSFKQYPTIKLFTKINGLYDKEKFNYEYGLNINYNFNINKNLQINNNTDISYNNNNSSNINNNLRFNYPSTVKSEKQLEYDYNQTFQNEYKKAIYTIEDIDLLLKQYQYHIAKENSLNKKKYLTKDRFELIKVEIELLKTKINKINLIKTININMIVLLKTKGSLIKWIKDLDY